LYALGWAKGIYFPHGSTSDAGKPAFTGFFYRDQRKIGVAFHKRISCGKGSLRLTEQLRLKFFTGVQSFSVFRTHNKSVCCYEPRNKSGGTKYRFCQPALFSWNKTYTDKVTTPLSRGYSTGKRSFYTRNGTGRIFSLNMGQKREEKGSGTYERTGHVSGKSHKTVISRSSEDKGFTWADSCPMSKEFTVWQEVKTSTV
jgi:hypothetical protein